MHLDILRRLHSRNKGNNVKSAKKLVNQNHSFLFCFFFFGDKSMFQKKRKEF